MLLFCLLHVACSKKIEARAARIIWVTSKSAMFYAVRETFGCLSKQLTYICVLVPSTVPFAISKGRWPVEAIRTLS